MKVNTIYETVSGEIGRFPQGAWCTIVRLQGCNLRCSYCDTKQSWDESTYTEMTPQEVVDKIHTKNILITGGEPLYQREELLQLLKLLLIHRDHVVQIETNGACKITTETWMEERADWVVDYKGISSGENASMGSDTDFVLRIYPAKFIKFVVADKEEVQKAFSVIREFKCQPVISSSDFREKTFAFSPMDGNPKLVKMIIDECQKDDFMKTILNDGQMVISVQMHKLVDMA